MAVKLINPAPLIVDIKRDSHEDGPGIRSVVFFKGCPLRCVFCHNPESQEMCCEIAFTEKDCMLCGRCAEVCKNGAIDLEQAGRIVRDKCLRCGECVKACVPHALRRIGQVYSIEELAELLLEDEPFYRSSGGGVTLSGGECTVFPYYLEALLKVLKKKDINVAIETAGYFDYQVFKEKILPYLDLIYYDIKFAEAETHLRYTGKSNDLILANLRQLMMDLESTGSSVRLQARIPLITDITTGRENLKAIVGLLKDIGVEEVSLLPYNPLGFEMLAKIGREPTTLPTGFMKPEDEKEIFSLFKAILDQTYREQEF